MPISDPRLCCASSARFPTPTRPSPPLLAIAPANRRCARWRCTSARRLAKSLTAAPRRRSVGFAPAQVALHALSSNDVSYLAQAANAGLLRSDAHFAAPATPSSAGPAPAAASALFTAAYQPVEPWPNISPAPGTLAFGAPLTSRPIPVTATSSWVACGFEGHVAGASTQTPQLSLDDTAYDAGADFDVHAGKREPARQSFEQLRAPGAKRRQRLHRLDARFASSWQLTGPDAPVVVPNYADLNRLSIGAGLAVPVLHGVTLNLNYDAQRLYGGYGLPGLVNLDAVTIPTAANSRSTSHVRRARCPSRPIKIALPTVSFRSTAPRKRVRTSTLPLSSNAARRYAPVLTILGAATAALLLGLAAVQFASDALHRNAAAPGTLPRAIPENAALAVYRALDRIAPAPYVEETLARHALDEGNADAAERYATRLPASPVRDELLARVALVRGQKRLALEYFLAAPDAVAMHRGSRSHGGAGSGCRLQSRTPPADSA